ncbi:MAG: zf-HC2 domain-containing protein [Candidatus Rokubacteria bacterium]|nr:zf-HC2 domain-containing protein [Candidatus Rokubacteria bacterium]
MTCDEARDLLSALVDDALTAAERAAVDAHLAACAGCGRDLDRLRRTVALLHAVEPVRAPLGFVDRVVEAARLAPWYRRVLGTLFLPLRAKLPVEAAAVLLVAVAAIYVFQQLPELQQAARPDTPAPTASETARPAAPEPVPPARPAPPPGASQEGAGAVREAPDAARASKGASAPPAAKGAPGESTAAGPTAPAPPDKTERVPGSRADAIEAEPKRAPASPRLAMKAPALADVSGRLSVADREAAERALGDLVARLGGAEVSRDADKEGGAVTIRIPREAFAELVQGLGRIGRWLPDREPADLPTHVVVTLRVTD